MSDIHGYNSLADQKTDRLTPLRAGPPSTDPDREAEGDITGLPDLLRPTTAAPLPTPSSVPGYLLESELGRGGMGVVYRAIDLAFDRPVAVKVLLGNPVDGGKRFLAETRITAQLQHPGIPSVYQVGTTIEGQPFLAMKLIRGMTLADKLRGKAPLDTVAVFEAIARAVGYAHVEGVIHRDLKPGNIMIGAFGEVQVMDWGLAKRIDDPTENLHETMLARRGGSAEDTQDGMVLGTVSFMAPEQAAGRIADVDAQSDVFGLGAILFAMLTGQPVFEGTSAIEICQNAMAGRVEPAMERLKLSTADPELVALCRRCLSVAKEDRPSDGASVADEVAHLRSHADERARRAEQERAGAIVQAAADQRRRRLQHRAALALGLVLAVGLAGTAFGYIRAVEAEQRAEEKRVRAVAAEKEVQDERMSTQQREREARSLLEFFQKNILSTARPKGVLNGLGTQVTVHDAIVASLPSIPKHFGDKPVVEAELRDTLAVTFAQLTDYQQAEKEAARAYTLFRE
ncbi:MAG: serine/threonine-protein kinase, partial [Gemmataceae bacterium]